MKSFNEGTFCYKKDLNLKLNGSRYLVSHKNTSIVVDVCFPLIYLSLTVVPKQLTYTSSRVRPLFEQFFSFFPYLS